MKDADQIEGFWGSKTSSVNFCEADYLHSAYIAEFHNAWTSLIFIWLPLVGLYYANPTKEWRFVWAYIQLIITGIGSVILHTTLTSAGQQADEIPMLWMCSAILYNVSAVKRLYMLPGALSSCFLGMMYLLPCLTVLSSFLFYATFNLFLAPL